MSRKATTLLTVGALALVVFAGCESPTEPKESQYIPSPTGAWSDGTYYFVVDPEWARFLAPQCEASSMRRPYVDGNGHFEVGTTFGQYTYPGAPREPATVAEEFNIQGVIVRVVTSSGRVIEPTQFKPTSNVPRPCPSL